MSHFNSLICDRTQRCCDLQAQGWLKRLPDGSVEMVTDWEKPSCISCPTEQMETMLPKPEENEEKLRASTKKMQLPRNKFCHEGNKCK